MAKERAAKRREGNEIEFSRIVAYALSFAVTGRFWLVHHRFFSEVTAFDGG